MFHVEHVSRLNPMFHERAVYSQPSPCLLSTITQPWGNSHLTIALFTLNLNGLAKADGRKARDRPRKATKTPFLCFSLAFGQARAMSVAEKGQKAKEVPSRAREKIPDSCLAFRHIFESVVTHWCEIPKDRLPLSLGLFLTYFYLSYIWQSEFFKNTPLPILNNYFKKIKI